MERDEMMSGIRLSIALPVLLFTGTCMSETLQLKIDISNIQPLRGALIVQLFNSEEDYLETPLQEQYVTVTGDLMQVQFDNLEAGRYAIAIGHDLNDNRKFDRGFMGRPKEPYAFSNNATGIMGPPDFAHASFGLEQNAQLHSIRFK